MTVYRVIQGMSLTLCSTSLNIYLPNTYAGLMKTSVSKNLSLVFLSFNFQCKKWWKSVVLSKKNVSNTAVVVGLEVLQKQDKIFTSN